MLNYTPEKWYQFLISKTIYKKALIFLHFHQYLFCFVFVVNLYRLFPHHHFIMKSLKHRVKVKDFFTVNIHILTIWILLLLFYCACFIIHLSIPLPNHQSFFYWHISRYLVDTSILLPQNFSMQCTNNKSRQDNNM